MNIKLKITGISKKEIERIINSCTVCIDCAQENGESEGETFEFKLADAECVEYDDLDDFDEDFMDCSDPDVIDDNPFEYADTEEELVIDDGFLPIGTPDLLEESDSPQEPIPMIKPDTNIDGLELSVRSYNCLRRAGVDTIEKLRSMTDEELRNVRCLSERGFNEIKEKMAAFKIEQKPKNDYLAMLDELVGLEDVKRQIRKIRALAKMNQDMPKDKAQVPIVLNMEFVGNPGTAKTTVARIIAGILAQVGLLSFKDIVEVGRADLVAKYEGQTAEKVKSVFRRAEGRLLFIDEAYSLVENCRGEFGDEAISTIVQEMENHRDNTVVIFAGYPENMEEFFSINPGLRSRVPFKISFKDYSVEELLDIAELEAKKRGFTIDSKAHDKLTELCSAKDLDVQKGNGRFCRNLVEGAILNYALRVYGDGGATEGAAEKKSAGYVLESDDFEMPENMKAEKKVVPIGFCA